MTKTIRGKAAKLSRRHFVVGSAAAGGGLALGFHVPFGIGAAAAQGAAPAEVNIWVAIKPDDTCVIRIARSEMGQGTITGLAQLVAEELECDWKQGDDRADHARPQPRPQARLGRHVDRRQPRHPHLAGLCPARRRGRPHDAAAGGGQRVEGAGRRAHGVGRRHHACRLQPPDHLRQGRGGGRQARREPDPKSIKLKDPRSWKIAGKPLKRLDTADKLNGSKVYAIDVKLPGMLSAAIKDCPVFGGKVKSYDESKIAGRPGVKKVVKVGDTAVAVVADTWWHAKSALDALPIVWDEGDNAKVSDATIAEHLKEGLTATETNGDRKNGDALKAIAGAAKKVEAIYSTPFLAHACMEPMNATVRYHARQGRGLGADAECRGLARGAVGSLRPADRQVRASTASTSAAASAGAAARRTTPARRSRSPRNSPAFRSS